ETHVIPTSKSWPLNSGRADSCCKPLICKGLYSGMARGTAGSAWHGACYLQCRRDRNILPGTRALRLPSGKRHQTLFQRRRHMRQSRWQGLGPVWNQLQTLQSEMNRVFDRWGQDGGRFFGLTATYPAVNVWEDEEQVCVEAELPGLDLSDLEIYVTGGNQLTLKGERKA